MLHGLRKGEEECTAWFEPAEGCGGSTGRTLRGEQERTAWLELVGLQESTLYGLNLWGGGHMVWLEPGGGSTQHGLSWPGGHVRVHCVA